jgi:hypothetical protein
MYEMAEKKHACVRHGPLVAVDPKLRGANRGANGSFVEPIDKNDIYYLDMKQ